MSTFLLWPYHNRPLSDEERAEALRLEQIERLAGHFARIP